VKIGSLTLTPDLRDGMWYVTYSLQVVADLEERMMPKPLLARWIAYQTKHASGKDGFGRYYEHKKHAVEAIRGFVNKEKGARAQSRPGAKRASATS